MGLGLEKMKLKEESDKNEKIINDLEYKSYLMNLNSFEGKLVSGSTVGIMAWFLLIMSRSFFLDIVPLELLNPFFAGVSVLCGVTGQKIMYKATKCSDKLKSISNMGNKKELLEERIRTDLEKEKLESKNKVLEKAYYNLDIVKSFKYSSVRHDFSNSDLENELAESNLDLENKEKKLDIATTKKFLSDKFPGVRSKFLTQRFSHVWYGLLGFLPFLCVYDIPGMMNQASTIIIGMVAPGVVGAATAIGYRYKKNKDNLEVFNKINDELGDEKLTRYKTKEEDFNAGLEKVINDTVSIKMTSLLAIDELDNRKIEQYEREENIKRYKQQLINTIEQYLPMSYEEFKSLDLEGQQKVINEVKLEQGRIAQDSFQIRFDEFMCKLEEPEKEIKNRTKVYDKKLF